MIYDQLLATVKHILDFLVSIHSGFPLLFLASARSGLSEAFF